MSVTITTGISPKYVADWDVGKAIREIIQNYLDSKQDFGVGGTCTWYRGMGVVNDFGPGLEPRHLALGISEKGADSRGKFGEGLKLALLVLAREGREVSIQAKGKLISPSIRFDEVYQTDLLVFDVKEVEPTVGTKVKFACTKEEYDEGRGYFEEFTNLTWIEEGKISSPSGHIYINGTRVGELKKSLFSYHFKESENPGMGNRDREIIDMSKVRSGLRTTLACTTEKNVMEKFFREAKKWMGHEEYSCNFDGYEINYYPNVDKEAWTQVAHQIFGDNVVTPDRNPNINKEAEYRGYGVLRDLPQCVLSILEACGFETALQIVSREVDNDQSIAFEDLTRLEQDNLVSAIEIVTKYYSDPRPISVLGIISLGSIESAPSGFFNRRTNSIGIARGELDDLEGVVNILLHETCHKVSGEVDCTPGFQEALLGISMGLIKRQEGY